MAKGQVKPTKKSSNPKTTGRDHTGGGSNPPRAQRNDTGEAKQQRSRQPKTHPGRGIGGVRKDK